MWNHGGLFTNFSQGFRSNFLRLTLVLRFWAAALCVTYIMLNWKNVIRQYGWSERLKVTHQHTPWSHWRYAGLEGSWHNIAHCVNTSPPYILCKNCDWNTLHNFLFYILKDTGERKRDGKSYVGELIGVWVSESLYFCTSSRNVLLDHTLCSCMVLLHFFKWEE